jgi:hypothetical protein
MIFRYKIHCNTENADEYWYLPSDAAAPTTCPHNTAHSVDLSSVVVIDNGGSPSPVTLTALPPAQPFASSTYRNKHDGSPEVSCPDNAATIIDFQLTAARGCYGGELIVLGAQFGDWISAEVYDTNSIVPTQVRSALCEAWPSVAKYIIKKYMPVDGVSHTVSVGIDTRPLIASVNAGLFLRITYNAVAAAGAPTRLAAANYFLVASLT